MSVDHLSLRPAEMLRIIGGAAEPAPKLECRLNKPPVRAGGFLISEDLPNVQALP